jgi:predicted TIM-barrel fold metal-dependent hydrolase
MIQGIVDPRRTEPRIANLEVIDTHTHVVSTDTVRYPLAHEVDAEQGWHRDHPVDTVGLLARADEAGVRALALVQALSCYGFDSRYVLDSARAHPGRTVAVGSVKAGDPDAVSVLRRDVTDGGMRGVRLFAVTGMTAPLDDPGTAAIVAAAADLGIPVVLLVLGAQLPLARALVAAFPSVPFVLDHCGFVDLSGGPSFADASDLFALADAENLHLKVSSICLQATPHPSALWRVLIERFGSERLMWGSDYPHTNEPGYAALVELARTTTEGLPGPARRDVLAATATRLWPELG